MLRRTFLAGAILAATTPVKSQDVDEQGTLNLSASLGSGGPLNAPLRWRVFKSTPDADGFHRVIVESTQPHPSLTVPPGDYVVHVSFGLASAEKSVTVGSGALNVALSLAAGALRIHCTAQDKPVDPADISLAVYVPERNNATARLVYAKAHPGEVIGVPEGNYHIASTYLDSVGVGSLGTKGPGAAIATNSITAGDVNVATGKIVDITLRHRVAKLTIKLVNAPGAGALANSTFTVLTPGGDIVRELAGAFPSLVLAEGEYVVVARHDAKTYQATFTVQSGMDRDVEVLAKGATN